MKSEKPNGRSPRDAALARLLADALDSKAAADAQSAACPDAEVLAAYADHGLPVQEASRWEGHIADCSRCQKIIAGVMVRGEDLAAELNEEGSFSQAPVIRKPAPQRGASGISRWPSGWHWWVPGLGLAAAVALWFVLHPGLSPSPAVPRAAAKAETSQSAAQANPATSSAKPEETQMAQANVPPPPASVAGSLRDSEEQRVNSAADALKKAAPKQEALQNERRALAESPAVSEITRADAAPDAKEKDGAAASALQTDTKTQIEARAETPAAPAAAAAPAAPATEASQMQGLARQLDGSARLSGTNQLKALAKAVSAPVVFGSPDRSVLWRVGSAGLIESSSDRGQTWRQQASGVTADLLAGVAPSAKIAWAVGKGGIIVRTEDGQHWQRVTPPALVNAAGAQNAAAPDWTAIDARDGLNATVVSRDLQRYATADGGRTWVQEQ